jgi:hypothetical protein
MNTFVKSIGVALALLTTYALPAAADDLIAEHVFATVGNVNTATYGTPGSPEEVTVSCTGGAYASGAFKITGTPTLANAHIQVSVPSNAVTISKIEVSAYTSNSRKVYYKHNTDNTTWSSTSQLTLTKTEDTYTLVNNPAPGALYFRVGGSTGGSGDVFITAVRVYAMPSVPTLALTSAAESNNQSVPENLEITDIVYTWGGTADGHTFEWADNAAPAGIEVAANSAAKTVTISGTPTAQGTYAYTIKATEAGASADATALTGTITVTEAVAVLRATPASLSAFNYLEGEGGPSAAQTLTLSGANLTPGDISLTASDNYEVSADNATFGASAVVAVETAALDETPVYIRLKAGLPAGSYSGSVSIDGAGISAPLTVALTGSVTTPLELVPVTTKTWTHADLVTGSYVGTLEPIFSADKTLRLMVGTNALGEDRTVHVNSAANAMGKIRMNNSGSLTLCNLSFRVTGPSRITVIAESTADGARTVAVATESGQIGTIPAPGRGNPAAGSVTYNGTAEETLYVYSTGSGIDITSIAVEPYTVAILTPDVSKAIVSEAYYTLTGMKTTRANIPAGVYIRKITYDDGSTDAAKVMIRK